MHSNKRFLLQKKLRVMFDRMPVSLPISLPSESISLKISDSLPWNTK